jgi:hypothetical protein
LVLQSTIQLSDEGLFANFASDALSRGANPYVALPINATADTQLDPNGWTFRMDGTHVQQFSYPIVALAVYSILGLLPVEIPLAVLGSLLALIASAFLVQRRWGNTSAIIFVGLWFTPIFQALVATGSTDFLLIPPLVMFANLLRERTSAKKLQLSLLLAIIVCLKQTAWLMTPFLILAASTDRDCHRNIDWSKFRDITSLTFVFSVFFNVVGGAMFGFRAYWKALMQPLSSALIPNGVGLADLVRSYGISNIEVLFFVSTVGLVGMFYVASRLLLSGRFICAMSTTSLPLLSHRGFLSYAIALTPVLICAPSAQRMPENFASSRKALLRTTLVILLIAPVISVALIALFTFLSPPGKLKISSLEYNAQYRKLVSFKLRGIGVSDSLSEYSYFVEGSSGITAPWVKATSSIDTITLLAPNQWAGTDAGQGFRVIATNPRTKMVRSVAHGRFPTLTVETINTPSVLRVHEVRVLKFRLRGIASIKGSPRVSLSQLGLQGSGVRTGILRLDQGGIGESSTSKLAKHDRIIRFTAECTQATLALQVVRVDVRTKSLQPMQVQGGEFTLACH